MANCDAHTHTHGADSAYQRLDRAVVGGKVGPGGQRSHCGHTAQQIARSCLCLPRVPLCPLDTTPQLMHQLANMFLCLSKTQEEVIKSWGTWRRSVLTRSTGSVLHPHPGHESSCFHPSGFNSSFLLILMVLMVLLVSSSCLQEPKVQTDRRDESKPQIWI